jgi:hypothetical protein
VYDDYIKDAERQRAEEANKPKGGTRRASTAAPVHAAVGQTAVPAAASGSSTLQGPTAAGTQAATAATVRKGVDEEAVLSSAGPSVARALCILDRMVCQNTYADVAMDFKYWDDLTDTFRCGKALGLALVLIPRAACCVSVMTSSQVALAVRGWLQCCRRGHALVARPSGACAAGGARFRQPGGALAALLCAQAW